MLVSLEYIKSKPGDFKICDDGHLNWYENEECFNCGSKKFSNEIREIKSWIEQEIEFLVNETEVKVK